MSKNILNEKYNLLKPHKTNNLVRIGRNMVGGYIVDLNILEQTNTLMTLGFGPEWSFELDYLKMKKGSNLIIYDHNLSAVPYIKQVAKYLRRFLTFRIPYKILKLRLDSYKKYKNFFKLKNVKLHKKKITFPQKNKNETDLNSAIKELDNDNKIFLKIDIQCCEYEIANQIAENSEKINMIVIVFYWINKNEKKFIDSIKKLLDKFKIVHIHANNFHSKLTNGLPKMLEVTFLNSKLIKENIGHVKDFPIDDLDYPCDPRREDISFSFK